MSPKKMVGRRWRRRRLRSSSHARDEHQIEQPELSQVRDGGVAGIDQAESVGSDQIAAKQQTDDAGHAGALEQGWPEQQRCKDHEVTPTELPWASRVSTAEAKMKWMLTGMAQPVSSTGICSG